MGNRKNGYPFLHKQHFSGLQHLVDLAFNPPLLESERLYLERVLCIFCGKRSREVRGDGNENKCRTLLSCKACAKKANSNFLVM